MSEVVKIQKTIYGLQGINSVIDTSFTQLVPPTQAVTTSSFTTVKEFFEEYDTIFFDIPVTGSVNSHLTLAQRSLDYVGVNLEDLQDEIATLREENVSLKNQLLTITNVKIGDLVNS
jgi:hypothetical protein